MSVKRNLSTTTSNLFLIHFSDSYRQNAFFILVFLLFFVVIPGVSSSLANIELSSDIYYPSIQDLGLVDNLNRDDDPKELVITSNSSLDISRQEDQEQSLDIPTVTPTPTPDVGGEATPTPSVSPTATPVPEWTTLTPISDQLLRNVNWVGNRFIIVGGTDNISISGTSLILAGSGLIFTSSFGSNWQVQGSDLKSRLSSVSTSNVGRDLKGSAQFVSVGNSGRITSSSDGITWTAQTSITIFFLTGVVSDGSKFVSVGGFGKIITSPDSKIWTAQTSGTSKHLNSIAHNGSQSNPIFISVGDSGTILKSSDGTSWEGKTSGTSIDLLSVIWGNSEFITVGESGLIMTSPDGETWTNRISGTSTSLWDIAWSGKTYIAVGFSGTIVVSTDGSTWAKQISGTNEHLFGVAFGFNRFVAVGTNGTVLNQIPDPVPAMNWVGFLLGVILLSTLLWGWKSVRKGSLSNH